MSEVWGDGGHEGGEQTGGLRFEAAVVAFYAQLAARQEPLGKEYAQVLCGNFYDLVVRT